MPPSWFAFHQGRAEKGWLVTKSTFLMHIPALFMMSPTQVIRHRKAVLMAVFSQLSNVCVGGGEEGEAGGGGC